MPLRLSPRKAATFLARSKERQETPKKNKYGNVRTEYNGRSFMSKKEADFARRLEHLRHAKNISDRVTKVEYQVPYKILIKNKLIFHYFADFRVTYADNHQEVIDVKGVRTDVYKIKKKAVEAEYDIQIIEI